MQGGSIAGESARRNSDQLMEMEDIITSNMGGLDIIYLLYLDRCKMQSRFVFPSGKIFYASASPSACDNFLSVPSSTLVSKANTAIFAASVPFVTQSWALHPSLLDPLKIQHVSSKDVTRSYDFSSMWLLILEQLLRENPVSFRDYLFRKVCFPPAQCFSRFPTTSGRNLQTAKSDKLGLLLFETPLRSWGSLRLHIMKYIFDVKETAK